MPFTRLYNEKKRLRVLSGDILTSCKSVARCASLYIFNVLTKGVQHKSMAKPVLKVEGYTSLSTHSIASY